MENKPKIYPQVYPDLQDWPIYKLSEDREDFVQEITKYTLNKILRKQSEDELADTIAKTIYRERIRMKEEPWKVDPPDESTFWRKVRKNLIRESLDKDKEASHKANELILEDIIGRYSEEIVGTFKIPTFKFARRFLTMFFNRLLNTAASRNAKRLFNTRYHLYERLKVKGAQEEVRSLMTKGEVVLVPTHFSNLDSILIGYAMDAIVGLPGFMYGAGLNLYNTGYTAYFMNRLGAYRVDRRKKNPIYLETLKSMSKLSIERGTNTLFFPGGTRSRSGALETKCKLGLLGTVIEAQRSLCAKPAGERKKVFVVPLVLSYPFVLEAPYLIEQHLKFVGKEHYIKARDESVSARKLLKFAWRFFSEWNDITLSMGRPMDVLGNFVDAEGRSFDQHGNEIDVAEYFMSNGKVERDYQREWEYTKMLGEKIVDRYHKENIVLSSHLLAYTAFNIIRNHYNDLDIFGVLRLPPGDYYFPEETICAAVSKMQEILFDMERNGKIKLSEEIRMPVEDLVKDGVNRLGTSHALEPLKFDRKGRIVSQDFKVLYFYHNRLENYGLDKKLSWNKFKLAEMS